jgi:ABC-type glycerol-3-phosphate transport system permease component
VTGQHVEAASRGSLIRGDPFADASVISLAIPLVVFFAFQRYFVEGLLAGSVK